MEVMSTFLIFIGIILFILTIGFLNSKQFKEYLRQRKEAKNYELSIQTNEAYFDSVENIRLDGVYILKDEEFINVIAFLPNQRVSYYSELDMQLGNSVGESYFTERNIKEQINNPITWANHSYVEGNEIKALFENETSKLMLVCKLKYNGQIQVFKQLFKSSGQTHQEWTEYNFQRFRV